MLLAMDHPNIPKYYNSFVYNENFYIISQYIKSSANLSSELEREVFFTESKAKEIINQVNSVIKYCLKMLRGIYLSINFDYINFFHDDNGRIFVSFL